MFQLWGKLFKENRMLKDITITDSSETKNRTGKVLDALDEICYVFDVQRPIWLDLNIKDFKKHDKTRFTKDSFIEDIDFDYLEIQVIDED